MVRPTPAEIQGVSLTVRGVGTPRSQTTILTLGGWWCSVCHGVTTDREDNLRTESNETAASRV